jgi:energy-coupling factor transporter ATP-binding protein EcfA2
VKIKLQSILNVAREFDAKPSVIICDYEGVHSKLRVPSPGVNLLLGKNGTGKSSLLRAMRDFTKRSQDRQANHSHQRAFPILGFGFQLPTDDEYLDYLHFVDDFKQSFRYKEIMSEARENYVVFDEDYYHERLFSLPLVESLNAALEDDFASFEFEVRNRFLSAVETLKYFNLPEYEVTAFEQRQEKIRQIRHSDLHHHVWVTPGNYRERFCEFLLHQLRMSTVHLSDEPDPWWGFFLNESDLWINQTGRQDLFVAALRDTFNLGELFLDRYSYDESPEISFLAQPDASENVQRFKNEFKNESGDSLGTLAAFDGDQFASREVTSKEVRDLDLMTRYAFPRDVLSIRNSGHFSSIPFSPGNSITDWISLVPRFISCIEIPAAVKPDQVVEIAKSYLRWSRSDVTDQFVDSEDLDGLQINLQGVDTLRKLFTDASRVLSQLDIGVAKVSPNIYVRSSLDSPIEVKIEFFGALDGEGMTLESASDGQLSAIFAVLSVLGERFSHSQSSNRAAVNLVVADEFDRHLHPTSADKLLGVLHQRAVEAELSLLVSTHSVPLLNSPTLASCRRLYSERDVLGRMTIGDQPPQSLASLAGSLGTSAIQARSLYGLHIVVEGNTDEIVLREALSDPRLSEGLIEWNVMDGMRQLKSLWRSSLSYLTSPMLVVYDNRSKEFEMVWHAEVHASPKPWIEQRALRTLENQLATRRRNQNTWRSAKHDAKTLIETTIKGNLKSWQKVMSGEASALENFVSLILESSPNPPSRDRLTDLVKVRTNLWCSGDEELASLLALAKEVLDPSRHDDYQSQARRMHFFGLDVPDIVDYLPLEYFMSDSNSQKGVPRKSTSWADARKRVASKSADDFKRSCGISESRVKEVLDQLQRDCRVLIGPRLIELRATAIGLLEPRS